MLSIYATIKTCSEIWHLGIINYYYYYYLLLNSSRQLFGFDACVILYFYRFLAFSAARWYLALNKTDFLFRFGACSVLFLLLVAFSVTGS